MISHPAPGADTLRRVARRATACSPRPRCGGSTRTCPGTGALPAEDRSWVGLVAQAGIRAFISWYGEPAARPAASARSSRAAPPELTRSISLQHTLQLVRVVVDVVEAHSDQLAAPGDERDLREAVLRYSREVAFSAAEVYARAAEVRGAWDARLEALVVDALVRGEADDAVRSRIAALGWSGRGSTLVMVGHVELAAGRGARRRPAAGDPPRRRRRPRRHPRATASWSSSAARATCGPPRRACCRGSGRVRS